MHQQVDCQTANRYV